MPPETIQPVRIPVSEEDLRKDLDSYVAKAIGLGATKASPVQTNDIVVDERVTLKCRIPKCFGYDSCIHCPPHTLKADETRRIVGLYRWGVVIGLEVPPSVIVRDKATFKERVHAYQTVFKVVNAVESAAFYDGHYLSVGFAAGSCKSTFCYDSECLALKGEKCRLTLRSRPSMEAVGIDCYRLATSIGWTIYPIGSDATADQVPCGTLMGLVLVD
jgi:predicted metal-binding protein